MTLKIVMEIPWDIIMKGDAPPQARPEEVGFAK